MTEKIRPDHLRRTAYVYVRQSSGHQVRHHHESRQRQYALTDRSRALGFAETVVIDEDQGKSGSGRQERSGFGHLLTAARWPTPSPSPSMEVRRSSNGVVVPFDCAGRTLGTWTEDTV